MATDTDHGGATTLSPDAAFSVPGNGTRMEILQALGKTDEPVSFSELLEFAFLLREPADREPVHLLTVVSPGEETDVTVRRAAGELDDFATLGSDAEVPVETEIRLNHNPVSGDRERRPGDTRRPRAGRVGTVPVAPPADVR